MSNNDVFLPSLWGQSLANQGAYSAGQLGGQQAAQNPFTGMAIERYEMWIPDDELEYQGKLAMGHRSRHNINCPQRCLFI